MGRVRKGEERREGGGGAAEGEVRGPGRVGGGSQECAKGKSRERMYLYVCMYGVNRQAVTSGVAIFAGFFREGKREKPCMMFVGRYQIIALRRGPPPVPVVFF